jgi:hypothetical protein
MAVNLDGFFVELPLSKGYSQIWVMVDRFTKMVHFIPITDETNKALDLARVFGKEIWHHHGLPIDIVSDQDR